MRGCVCVRVWCCARVHERVEFSMSAFAHVRMYVCMWTPRRPGTLRSCLCKLALQMHLVLLDQEHHGTTLRHMCVCVCVCVCVCACLCACHNQSNKRVRCFLDHASSANSDTNGKHQGKTAIVNITMEQGGKKKGTWRCVKACMSVCVRTNNQINTSVVSWKSRIVSE